MSDTGTFTRLFTVDEADALIPRLRPAVEELLAAFGAIRSEIELAARETKLPPGSAQLAQQIEARGVVPRLLETVNHLVGQIQSKGCLVNGPEQGLIDFPCLFNEEIVFLCWKYGEPRIGYWHRIPDGFAGRRPLLDQTSPEEGVRLH